MTRVTATYDGFSPRQDTYAYSTEDTADGIAYVMITHPGLWMVRVEHQVAEANRRTSATSPAPCSSSK